MIIGLITTAFIINIRCARMIGDDMSAILNDGQPKWTGNHEKPNIMLLWTKQV